MQAFKSYPAGLDFWGVSGALSAFFCFWFLVFGVWSMWFSFDVCITITNARIRTRYLYKEVVAEVFSFLLLDLLFTAKRGVTIVIFFHTSGLLSVVLCMRHGGPTI